MRFKWAVSLLALAVVLPVAAQDAGKAPTTAQEKIGYAVGAELAGKFKKEKIDFDVEMAIQAMRDVMAGKPQMDSDEIHFVLGGFQAEVRRRVKTNKQLANLANREEGEKFLAENKDKEGVVSLPSAVQYKVITKADGPRPKEGDFVIVNYRGTLLNGDVFDKSAEGKPVNLKLAALIPGWRDTMLLMPVGSKWQIWVPSKLAYGEAGFRTIIGPNETLAFEIELVAIGK
jgi:FKBP-type peptidyl-prolyl cis-trans isomerase FklB